MSDYKIIFQMRSGRTVETNSRGIDNIMIHTEKITKSDFVNIFTIDNTPNITINIREVETISSVELK